MSDRYRYAIIGTGRPWKSEGATGFGMAHPHYRGFVESGLTDLVAIAELKDDHANDFLAKYQSDAKRYMDYKELLRIEKPDIVSVTLWPHLHAEITIAAAEAGVRAIHCEKPMATTWGDAKRMKAAADANGTILTFNHQRRFLEPFQSAKRLLDKGSIGELKRLEAQCSDMFDWGTHWLDMLFFFNNETPAEWVIGQIDSREERRVFGAWAEEQAICHFKFVNGVYGMLVTGFEANIGTAIRLIGSTGTIEIGWGNIPLRISTESKPAWKEIKTAESIHGEAAIDRACADLVKALKEPGYSPLLRASNAIQSTEVIYSTFESSRWRGRIDLPLKPEDSALQAMVTDRLVGPNRVS